MKMTANITIRKARPADCADVAFLLKTSDLPIDDIDSQLDDFLVATNDERIIGTVGLERCGETGLLRSLAVAPMHRNLNIGGKLHDEVIRRAAEQKVQRLYLITTTAAKFFEDRGFKGIARKDAPEFIKQHDQFTRLCPDSAIIMEKAL